MEKFKSAEEMFESDELMNALQGVNNADELVAVLDQFGIKLEEGLTPEKAYELFVAGKSRDGSAGLQHKGRSLRGRGFPRFGLQGHGDHGGRQPGDEGLCHRRPAGQVQLFLRLRAGAHAPGSIPGGEDLRPVQPGGADGMRIRGLHGLQHQNRIRPQARLPGRPGV